MATTHEILSQALKIKDALKLSALVIVLDQVTYAKAFEVQWKHSIRCQSMVLRFWSLSHSLYNSFDNYLETNCRSWLERFVHRICS